MLDSSVALCYTAYVTEYKHSGNEYEHRRVWEAHNGPIPEGMLVHHKDHDKWNNDIANLELLSRVGHAEEHEMGTVIRGVRPRVIDYLEVARLRQLGYGYKTIASAVGCSPSGVRKALKTMGTDGVDVQESPT